MGSFELSWMVVILLALFYLLLVGRSLMLAARGVNPWVLGQGKRGLRKLMELLLLAGLLYWTFENVNAALGYRWVVLPAFFYRSWWTGAGMAAAGCLAMLLGLALFAGALVSFGASWRIGIDRNRPGQQLVTAGVFGRSRNPIFVAVDLFFLGSLLVWGNLFFLLLFLAAFGGIHYQILQEERFLHEQYAEEYVRYQQRVRRYW